MTRPVAHTCRRGRGDDGAVFVEFALFAPVLVLLALGLLEFGFIYKDYNILGTATRSAVRAGANSAIGGGARPDANRTILLSVAAGLSEVDAAEIDRVIVYKASATDGAVPASCVSAPIPGSGYGTGGANCTIYSGTFMTTLAATPGIWVPTTMDAGWVATGRDVYSSDGTLDYVGVHIILDHDAITGLFGSTYTISDSAVMAVEPCIDSPSTLCND